VAIENFTGYTEVDPSSSITKDSNTIDWTAITRNEAAYVYSDKGAAHFDGDFEWQFEWEATSSSATGAFVCVGNLTNAVSTIRAIYSASGSCFYCRDWRAASVNEIGPVEMDGGSVYVDIYYNPTTGTRYYITLDRDESIGTYGQLRMRIYTDASRTTLVNTQTIALHTSKKDFRNVMPVSTWDDGVTDTKTGYIENLDLQEAVNNPWYHNVHQQ
jgi:hypothetical protein